MSGVTLSQFAEDENGENPLKQALVSSLAQTAGVSQDQIELTIRQEGRRGLGIRIEFKITIETASLGQTALLSVSDASSSGNLANTFADEASKRGEVAKVTTAVLAVVTSPTVAPTVMPVDDQSSYAVYYTVGLLHLLVVVCLLIGWAVMVRNCMAASPSPDTVSNSGSQSTIELITLSEKPNVLSTHDPDTLQPAHDTQQMQTLATKCG